MRKFAPLTRPLAPYTIGQRKWEAKHMAPSGHSSRRGLTSSVRSYICIRSEVVIVGPSSYLTLKHNTHCCNCAGNLASTVSTAYGFSEVGDEALMPCNRVCLLLITEVAPTALCDQALSASAAIGQDGGGRGLNTITQVRRFASIVPLPVH